MDSIEERAYQWLLKNWDSLTEDNAQGLLVEVIQAAHDAALERAAKVCKDLQTMQERYPHDNCGEARARCYGQCAQEIRALKGSK